MMADIEVHSVTFLEDGIVVQYMESTDVRVKGAVFKTQTLNVSSRHPDYAEDIDGLQRKVVKVLRNALEDFNDSEPYTPDVDDEEEDERGMGE